MKYKIISDKLIPVDTGIVVATSAKKEKSRRALIDQVKLISVSDFSTTPMSSSKGLNSLLKNNCILFPLPQDSRGCIVGNYIDDGWDVQNQFYIHSHLLPSKRLISWKHGKNIEINCPDLLWSLQVYFSSAYTDMDFKLRQVSTENTDKLKTRPYIIGNVDTEGFVCFGYTDYDITSLKEANNFFWNSPFSSDYGYVSEKVVKKFGNSKKVPISWTKESFKNQNYLMSRKHIDAIVLIDAKFLPTDSFKFSIDYRESHYGLPVGHQSKKELVFGFVRFLDSNSWSVIIPTIGGFGYAFNLKEVSKKFNKTKHKKRTHARLFESPAKQPLIGCAK